MAKRAKTGGRKAGTPNKATQARKALIEKAALESGITPLEVMLQTMVERWEANDKAGACAIAKDAAPYVHPKLAQVDGSVSGEFVVEIVRFSADEDSE